MPDSDSCSSIASFRGERVFVAGHRGMVGAALARRLARENCDLLTVGRDDVDLRDQQAVRRWMRAERPTVVFLAAAKVGGILANSNYPADFIYDNMMISANIIYSSYEIGVKKLVNIGSTCIYPKFCDQPIVEDALLTGALEPTNAPYAVAKISALTLAAALARQHGCDFISAMPTNLYGPGDTYDLATSHVLPALMRKAHMAKVSGASSMTVWGSGAPRREFLHCDDCADALVHLATRYSGVRPVNVGSGSEIDIRSLAELVAAVVGFDGALAWDSTKPDGAPRRLLDSRVLRGLGWTPSVPLKEGIAGAYEQARGDW